MAGRRAAGPAAGRRRQVRGTARRCGVPSRRPPRPERSRLPREWARRSGLAPGTDLRLDAVLDPVGVPPLPRIDRDAVQQDAEVEVVAAREARGAAAAQQIASPHRLPFLYVYGGE